MEQPINTLLSNGTITSVFLSVLLITIVLFAGWAKKLIENQLKQKDDRITRLETDVKELQHSYKTELVDMISANQRMMQRSTDTFNRLETMLDNMNNQNK